MRPQDFKRNTFIDVLKKKSVKKILTDKSIIIKEIIQKDFYVSDISSLDSFKNNSIIFLKSNAVDKFLSNLNSNLNYSIHAFIESPNITNKKIKSYTLVNNLKSAYNIIINNFLIHPDHLNYKDKFTKKKNSLISVNANIHKSSIIGNNCVIGKGVIIGSRG